MNIAGLEPRPNDPPTGWDQEVFEKLTAAIAAALVAAVRREEDECHRVEVHLDVNGG